MTVETYSESQSDRSVLTFQGADGQPAMVIIMRRGARTWLVLNGAERTTVTMTGPQTGELIDALRSASRGLPTPEP